MANRNIILLHLLESDTYEFYGSPASLYDRHEAKELLIAQTSLNNHFSKMAAQGKDLGNDYCEIRKADIIFPISGFAEDRLHLKNIQINLVFYSVCTIFAP